MAEEASEPPPPPPEEAPAAAPAEEAPAPAEAAEQAPPPADIAKPSKSNLVDKRVSTVDKTQSHVRVVEPGQEEKPAEEPEKKEPPAAPPEPERRKSEGERRKSEGERRKSEGERKKSEPTKLSADMSVTSQRGSKSQRGSTISKEALMRRQSDSPSKARAAIGSTISIRKTQSYVDVGGPKTPKFMNTYKLDSEKPFIVEKVEKILRDVLIEALDNLTYDPVKCPKRAKWASSAIRARVKDQDYDRYKLVIIVTIGEKRYQDMCSVVRFLWDIERDKYALQLHENMYVYAAAMCFGLYYE